MKMHYNPKTRSWSYIEEKNSWFHRAVYWVFPVDPKFRYDNIWKHIGMNLLALVALGILYVTIVPFRLIRDWINKK